jgi:hypothetical protein
MYLYATVQLRDHVFVLYKYITDHLNRSIQIYDLSVEP